MYQAIANNGVRIAPTMVASTTVDGQQGANPPGAATQVMSPATSRHCSDMLRGTIQGGDINHRGTAPQAEITGYQVAGKTGTAQKVDPATSEYSQTAITSTFAGIVPGRQPQVRHRDHAGQPEGQLAGRDHQRAPLFHDIAAYAMRAADVRRRPPRHRSTTCTCRRSAATCIVSCQSIWKETGSLAARGPLRIAGRTSPDASRRGHGLRRSPN